MFKTFLNSCARKAIQDRQHVCEKLWLPSTIPRTHPFVTRWFLRQREAANKLWNTYDRWQTNGELWNWRNLSTASQEQWYKVEDMIKRVIKLLLLYSSIGIIFTTYLYSAQAVLPSHAPNSIRNRHPPVFVIWWIFWSPRNIAVMRKKQKNSFW